MIGHVSRFVYRVLAVAILSAIGTGCASDRVRLADSWSGIPDGEREEILSVWERGGDGAPSPDDLFLIYVREPSPENRAVVREILERRTGRSLFSILSERVRHPGREGVDAAVEMLVDPRLVVRRAAIHRLSEAAGDPVAAEALRRTIGIERRADMDAAAVSALLDVGGEAEIPFLAGTAGREPAPVGSGIRSWIRRTEESGGADRVEVLRRLTGWPGEPSVRLEAARALWKLDGRRQRPFLEDRARFDPVPEVRAEIRFMLEEVGEP